jgi:hypothetical protein
LATVNLWQSVYRRFRLCVLRHEYRRETLDFQEIQTLKQRVQPVQVSSLTRATIGSTSLA